MPKYAVQLLSKNRWLKGDSIGEALGRLDDMPGEAYVAIKIGNQVVGVTSLERAREGVATGLTVTGNILSDDGPEVQKS